MIEMRIAMVTAALCWALPVASNAQQLTWQQAAGGQIKVNDQGAEIQLAARPHFEAAQKAAGSDFRGGLLLCNTARPTDLKWKLPTSGELRSEEGAHVEPARIFDNLYYLGAGGIQGDLGAVAAWALATNDGIILIDALNNKGQVESVIEPGLRKFGLDPAQIKYVVLTHGHGDHFGGAAYIQQKYHARVLMSEIDWTLAPTMLDKPFFDPPPARDMVIHDGDKLTLGEETLTMYITPGHTPGTVSILIPVTDRGQPHVAALWGGTGFNFPHSPANFKVYSDSADRFAKLAAAAGADVPLSPHSENDRALQKIAHLKMRGPNDPNPFVVGQEGVQRFLTVFSECAKAYAAQITQ